MTKRTTSPSAPKTTQRRRPSKAELRATARRRARRRQLAYGLAGLAAVAVAVVLVTTGDGGSGGGSGGVGPAAPGQVRVTGGPHDGLLSPGEEIPLFSAPEMNGGRVSWTQYEGTPTVLAVRAPWCPHCQVELPVLARVAADFPGVELVSVATQIDARPGPAVDGYMRDNGLTFRVALDDTRGTLGAALGISGFPTVYYVNSQGVVEQATEGEVDEATLRSLLGSLA